MLVMIGPWTGWIERCLQQSGLPHLLQAIELEPPTDGVHNHNRPIVCVWSCSADRFATFFCDSHLYLVVQVTNTACMILRPCLFIKPVWNSSTLRSFAASRSLPLAALTTALTSSSLQHSTIGTRYNPVLSHTLSFGPRSMPWAGQVAFNSNLLHLKGTRKGLAASQRLGSDLAPYCGGLAVLSAGSLYLQRQKARQSRQRSVLSQGAAFVSSTPTDVNLGDRALSSSSDSDADPQPASGDKNPAAVRDK